MKVTPQQWWYEVRGPHGKEYFPAYLPLVDNAPAYVNGPLDCNQEHLWDRTLWQPLAWFCRNSRYTALQLVEGYGLVIDQTCWCVFPTEEEAYTCLEQIHAQTHKSNQHISGEFTNSVRPLYLDTD